MLSPIAWRTPPRHYGPWESVVSLLTEGLLSRGVDVTLFATKDSTTSGRLVGVCEQGYEEDPEIVPKVWECLHIAQVFENAASFDLIHNHFDFLPLSYSSLVNTPMVTTIHGFSSARILPVYEKYDDRVAYISISDADRAPSLNYLRTIYHGINLAQFEYNETPEEYLLYFGRIHPEKGTAESIEIAKRVGRKLILAGIIQDQPYFESAVKPHIDGEHVTYIGSVGPAERNDVLRNAYALLHPISFEEPFGLSIVEAMACGTPTIAFPLGSMREIIESGKNGFLVRDIDDGCNAVSRIEEISRQSCRKTAEQRFSVERMVSEYMSAYEEILSEAAKAP